MKIIKQVVKLIITPDKLSASCINNKGNTVAIILDLPKKPEVKHLVDEFANDLLNIIDREIG